MYVWFFRFLCDRPLDAGQQEQHLQCKYSFNGAPPFEFHSPVTAIFSNQLSIPQWPGPKLSRRGSTIEGARNLIGDGKRREEVAELFKDDRAGT